jgi:hypothetical protein
MSLVSLSNFGAPFKQRVHLITIVLVTIVFATLRLSGASIEVVTNGEQKRSLGVSGSTDTERTPFRASGSTGGAFGGNDAVESRSETVASDEILKAMRAQRAQEAKRADAPLKLNQGSQGDLIEDVMRPADPNHAKAKEDEHTDSSSGALSDIEKQLGLK